MLNTTTKEGRLINQPNPQTYNNRARNGQTYQQMVVYFTVAVDRNFKNRQGQYDADFFKVKVTGFTANYLVNIAHVQKGDKVLLHGTERTNRFQSNSFFNQQGKPATFSQTYILIGRNGYAHLEARSRRNQGQAPYQQQNGYPQQPQQPMNNYQPQNNGGFNPMSRQPTPQQPQRPMPQPNQMPNNAPQNNQNPMAQQQTYNNQPNQPQQNMPQNNSQPQGNNQSQSNVARRSINNQGQQPRQNVASQQQAHKANQAPESSVASASQSASNREKQPVGATNGKAPETNRGQKSTASNGQKKGKIDMNDDDLPF